MSLTYSTAVSRSAVSGVVHVTSIAQVVEGAEFRERPSTRVFGSEDTDDDWADPCFTYDRDEFGEMIDEEAAMEPDHLADDLQEPDWDDYDGIWPRPRPNGPSRRERIQARLWDMERELDEDWLYHGEEERIQDRLDVHESKAQRSRRFNSRERSDARHRKYVGRKSVCAKPSEVSRYPVGTRMGEAFVKACERLEEQEKERREAILAWLDDRKIFRNQHGWLYWCHPEKQVFKIGDFEMEKCTSPRQGARLTSDEFRFFSSLSCEEQMMCLHKKCKPDPIKEEIVRGRYISRPNSWKRQRGQTRQWESPRQRQGHAKKAAEPSYQDEQSTFERELTDRLQALRVKLYTLRASNEQGWSHEVFGQMNEISKAILMIERALWSFGKERADMEEIFWRLRNHGEIPMDVLLKIAEEYGCNGLISFLMVAGLSREEAYQMEEKVSERISGSYAA